MRKTKQKISYFDRKGVEVKPGKEGFFFDLFGYRQIFFITERNSEMFFMMPYNDIYSGLMRLRYLPVEIYGEAKDNKKILENVEIIDDPEEMSKMEGFVKINSEVRPNFQWQEMAPYRIKTIKVPAAKLMAYFVFEIDYTNPKKCEISIYMEKIPKKTAGGKTSKVMFIKEKLEINVREAENFCKEIYFHYFVSPFFETRSARQS